jgi:TatD DNase family protein
MCNPQIPAAYRAPTAGGAPEAGTSPQREFPPAPEPLPVPVMDNHTHLDFPDGQAPVGIKEALDAAAAVGVQGAVQVGCDLESSRFTVQAVDLDERLLGAVALHPNDAPRYAASGRLEDALAEIEQLAAHPRIRAIGETGLDFYRTEGEGLAHQRYSFRRHIDIAKRLDLTLQIHDRDAHDDVVQVLKEEGAPERVVFHCFSGDEELAVTCNREGWWMSFAGTLTFKNAANLRAALSAADPDLLLVETDAPFLTPHPHRGRPNASYMIPYTVRAMAELTNRDLAGLCAGISQNTVRAYGKWD